MSYRIAKLSSFYSNCLRSYYSENPEIINKSYKDQYKHLMNQNYGYSDFFIRYLKDLGYQGWEIVHNAKPLQDAWAKENNASGSNIILNQLIQYQPEIVFIHDSASFSDSFIQTIKDKVKSLKLIIGQCCSPYTHENMSAFGLYDFMLTCSQKFVAEFNNEGLKSYLFRHAFEASLINKISRPDIPENEIIFIGSLLQREDFHNERIKYIEGLLRNKLPVKMYGYIEQDKAAVLLAKQSAYLLNQQLKRIGLKNFIYKSNALSKTNLLKEFPRKTIYSKEILDNIIQVENYGLKMLQTLADYSVAFNIHAQIAGDFAANIRLYEATGAGTALLTDHKSDISDIFEPDKEIITYSSIEDCIERSGYLINNPSEALEIAKAGQKRTLKDHSVKRRVEQLHELITITLRNK